jgi:hypothetical protein
MTNASWNPGGAPIGGNLSWGNANASAMSGKDLAGTYAKAYNEALTFNKQNYNNVLQGYQQVQQQMAQQSNAIRQQYVRLNRNVQKGLTGAENSAREEITDQYAALGGQQAQQLIDRGLGNTTVQSAVSRGLEKDEAKSRRALASDFAQLREGYRSQLGQARLGFMNNAMNAQAGMAQNQLSWMDSVTGQYPDAGMYAQLAQLYGGAKQHPFGDPRAAGGGGGAAAGLGYMPRAAPSYYGGGGDLGGGPYSGANLYSGWATGAGGSSQAVASPYWGGDMALGYDMGSPGQAAAKGYAGSGDSASKGGFDLQAAMNFATGVGGMW